MCITHIYKPLSYYIIMPSRDDYKNAWDKSDVEKARKLAQEVGIAGKTGKYAGAWTDAERDAMRKAAEEAGITGSKGKFAGCITRHGDTITIDAKCLRDAAESAGLDDKYRSKWS